MEVVRFALSDSGATAATGINVTNARVASKLEAGPIALAFKNLKAVGGVCTDYSGNIYVSDQEEHVVMKLSEGGSLTTYAGVAGSAGRNGTLTNVAAATARFNKPMGLCCDKSGNVYVADSVNNQIRVITPDRRVSHVAGNGLGIAGFVNSTLDGGTAQFNNPVDVAIDSAGVLYVCDKGNHAIRMIKGGKVITIAGNGSSGDVENEQLYGANKAVLNSPNSIALDPEGNILICDSGNYKIKKLTTRGYIYLHSGAGILGRTIGTAYTSRYVDLRYSAVDRSGNMYVVDRGNALNSSRLIKVSYDGVPGVIADFATASSYDKNNIGVAVNPSQKLFVTFTSDAEAYSSSSSSSVDSSSSSSSVDSSSSSSSVDSSSSSSSSVGYSSSSSSSSSSSVGYSSSSSVDSSSSSSSVDSSSSSSSS